MIYTLEMFIPFNFQATSLFKSVINKVFSPHIFVQRRQMCVCSKGLQCWAQASLWFSTLKESCVTQSIACMTEIQTLASMQWKFHQSTAPKNVDLYVSHFVRWLAFWDEFLQFDLSSSFYIQFSFHLVISCIFLLCFIPAVILCVLAPGVHAIHRPSGVLWLLQKCLLHFHQWKWDDRSFRCKNKWNLHPLKNTTWKCTGFICVCRQGVPGWRTVHDMTAWKQQWERWYLHLGLFVRLLMIQNVFRSEHQNVKADISI